jgi:hypothetical protein
MGLTSTTEVPRLNDGSADWPISRKLLAEAAQPGVRSLVTTPPRPKARLRLARTRPCKLSVMATAVVGRSA